MSSDFGGSEFKNAQREVEISQDYYIGKYEVTQAQWQAVMGDNPSYFSRTGGGKHEVTHISEADLRQFPVESVSWENAQTFVKKLTDLERNSGWIYRLPMEAEWEYACRGGATSKEDCSFDFYLAKPSNDLASNQANFDGNYPCGNATKGKYLGRPTGVGLFNANTLGVFDMHGNVWEWCHQDWNTPGGHEVSRGGGWVSFGNSCRAAVRRWESPFGLPGGYQGLRVVRARSEK